MIIPFCSSRSERSALPVSGLARGAWLGLCALACVVAAAGAPAPVAESAGGLRKRAQEALDRALIEEKGWVRVHAAETLVALGEGPRVRAAFLREREKANPDVTEIGLCRVLAFASADASERQAWGDRIEQALLRGAPADRPFALESLAKLGWRLPPEGQALARRLALNEAPAETVIPWWTLALAGDPEARPRLLAGLSSSDSVVRRRSAYALRWLKSPDAATLRSLVSAVEAEPAGTDGEAFLLSSAFVLNARPERRRQWTERLLQIVETGSVVARWEAAQALVGHVSPADLPRLGVPLGHAHADVRIGAAWIILAAR